jgi:23S rRNA (adenine2503-C2)-methyltransferase
MQKTDLKNLTIEELGVFVAGLGLKAFRTRQIFAWLYRPGITDFSQMTDIAKDVRILLAEKACFSRFKTDILEESEDGTIKFGFRLHDGYLVESVLIPEEDRNTLCVSSQVGCAMGCRFCLTGTMGFKRNLLPAEIVNQVQAVAELLGSQGKPGINNLVFMGMGEPLANFDNVVAALKILMEQQGLNFSSRRITVSTCGIIPRIKELGERVPVNLAISLHAADDATRDMLMPVNKTYPLDDLLAACRSFPLPNRRKVMIEYIMIRDLNDSDQHARRLVKKLHGLQCKVNLIPFNESEHFPFRAPSQERLEAFQQILRNAKYTALIRNSRGADISAACGQLAALSE